jgi:ribosomal protein S4
MSRKHGHTTTVNGKTVWSPTYVVWAGMMARVKSKPSYLAKGIKVCERWKSFPNFLADVGERPLGPTKFTLDRIDNLGNYEPGNCRWATQRQQTNNQQRNRWMTINGERMTAAQASQRFGVKSSTIYVRMDAGWDDWSAANLPPVDPLERHRGDHRRGS